jgi:hypothetical protein
MLPIFTMIMKNPSPGANQGWGKRLSDWIDHELHKRLKGGAQ